MAPIWSSFVESGRISAVLYVVDSSSPETIGKKHALKKYDQFARNFCYKNNEYINFNIVLEEKFREIAQLCSNIFFVTTKIS